MAAAQEGILDVHEGFAHIHQGKSASRTLEGKKHGAQPLALFLLVIQTLLAIGFMFYYQFGYTTFDFEPLKNAINNRQFRDIPLIMAQAQSDPITQGMKDKQLVFIAIVTSLSFIAGSVSIVRLNRAGISVAIICQIALWSVIHMQFSNDKGLIVFAGVVDAVSVLTCATLYRLSDSIQEYRIGSENTPPTKADVDRFMWGTLACSISTLGVGIVLIILTSQRDLELVMRNAKLAVWVGHTLGGLTILSAALAFLGASALKVLRSRWLLVAAFGLSMCVLSFACFYIIWYAYADEGLALFCGLSGPMKALSGWDDGKCRAQKRVHDGTTAFIFLTIIFSGLMGWCSLQLSERAQSFGIAGGKGFEWTIGHPMRLLGLEVSGIRLVRLLINLELLAMWSFGSLLLAFALALRADNGILGGRLDKFLRPAWYVVFGVIAVAASRFLKTEFDIIESRRILVFTLIFQLWVAGNAFHAFFIVELTHRDGFSVEPYIKIFTPSLTSYVGSRRDLLHSVAVMHGLLWVTEVFAVVINLLELETDYGLHGFLWAAGAEQNAKGAAEEAAEEKPQLPAEVLGMQTV